MKSDNLLFVRCQIQRRMPEDMFKRSRHVRERFLIELEGEQNG